VIAIALGAVILWRTIPIAISPPALMIGIAFIGFGVYRLWLGYTRLKQLRKKD
jgi:tellurite resistance protein TehA-like permease